MLQGGCMGCVKALSGMVKRKLILMIMLFLVISNVVAAETYTVDAAANDETFIINNEKFSAKTYCFNINEGDEVIFIEGSPFGACVSAEFLNLKTKEKCAVWCD